MATTNLNLFSWNDVDLLPELQRLPLVLDYLPDEVIVQALKENARVGEMITLLPPCGEPWWQALSSNTGAWHR